MTAELDAVRPRVNPVDREARDAAGLLLGRLTLLPALVLLPFLLVGFPLLLIGYFKPIPVIAGWLALTALIVPYAWRRIPSVTGAAAWGTRGEGLAKPTPRWVLWSLIAIAVAFGVFNAAFHSQFVIIEYDAAAYMQFAKWISVHGTAVIPQNAQLFGGHPASIVYASAAQYAVGNHIVPQFMSGMPMVLSLGYWAGGARLARVLGAGARRARRLRVRRPGRQAGGPALGAVRRAGDRGHHPHAVREPRHLERVARAAPPGQRAVAVDR